MRSDTRHQLKQDKFAQATAGTVSWAVTHRPLVRNILIGLILVVALVLGGYAYMRQQNQKAAAALATAMRTYDAPVVPAGTPVPEGIQAYNSAEARYRAALPQFQSVADQFGRTKNGKMARYMMGITNMHLGDFKAAEMQLKEVEDSRDRDLSPLARFALANVYRSTNREGDAAKLYKELIDSPTRTVPKATAQLELAAMYERTQPAEAARLYEQIQKDEPNTPAAQIAASRMGGGKPQ